MKPHISLVVLMISTLILVSADLDGHGGQFKLPVTAGAQGEQGESGSAAGAVQKGYSFPGGGPQIAFSESRWEFWWDFHHEPFLNLRGVLYSRTPAAGVIDFPFEQITSDEKRIKLVRQLSNYLQRAREQSVRSAAVLALARTKDPNVVPYIEIAYRKDSVLEVRTDAVLALGVTENPRAIGILRSILDDDKVSMEIRFFAAISLGLIGGEKAAMVLKDYLKPDQFRRLKREIQYGVSFAAGLTNEPTLAPMVRDLLVNNVADGDVNRSFLVTSLGRLADRTANPLLVTILEKDHAKVKRSAAVALGVSATSSDKDVIQALTRAAGSDGDSMVRNFACIALGRIGGPEAEKALLKLFKTVTSSSKNAFVAISLGLTGNSDNGAIVLQRFKALRDTSTRSAVAIALGLLKYTPALGELRRTFDKNSDPIFRSYCAQALGLMEDADSIERLRKTMTESNDVELIRSCAIALGLIGDHRAVELLQEMCGRKRSDVVRQAASYCIGLIGDRNSIDLLTEIAGNDANNSQIKSYAIIALGLLGRDNKIPVVSRVTRNMNYTILETSLYEIYNVN